MGTVAEFKKLKVTNTLDTSTILDMLLDPHKREAIKKHHDNLDEDYGIDFVKSMKSKTKLHTKK